MKRNYKYVKDETRPGKGKRVSANNWSHCTQWKNHMHYMGARRAAFGGS